MHVCGCYKFVCVGGGVYVFVYTLPEDVAYKVRPPE